MNNGPAEWYMDTDEQKHDDEDEAYLMYNENAHRTIETRRAARTTRLRRMLSRWRGETM